MFVMCARRPSVNQIPWSNTNVFTPAKSRMNVSISFKWFMDETWLIRIFDPIPPQKVPFVTKRSACEIIYWSTSECTLVKSPSSVGAARNTRNAVALRATKSHISRDKAISKCHQIRHLFKLYIKDSTLDEKDLSFIHHHELRTTPTANCYYF